MCWTLSIQVGLFRLAWLLEELFFFIIFTIVCFLLFTFIKISVELWTNCQILNLEIPATRTMESHQMALRRRARRMARRTRIGSSPANTAERDSNRDRRWNGTSAPTQVSPPRHPHIPDFPSFSGLFLWFFFKFWAFFSNLSLILALQLSLLN